MSPEDANEFLEFLDIWKPKLNEAERRMWYSQIVTLHGRTAFAAITELFKTEDRRPSFPTFRGTYKRHLMDTTPVQPSKPEARDEVPAWVKGWKIARSKGDYRLWPEQEPGFRQLHEEGSDAYLWERAVEQEGIMPQEARLEYMDRAEQNAKQRSESAKQS